MKRILSITGLIMIVLLLPILFWFLDDKQELQIAIIDKTVPNESFREHLGITWVLNHFGYVKQNGQSYKAAVDFNGFVPNEEDQSYQINRLLDSYDKMDVIYLADTYGVYKEDLPWIDKKREGARSSLIYGGLEKSEWQAIKDRLQQEKRSTFIAEFNALASPTDENVRQSMSDTLGLEWSGWMGRFFDELDLERNNEIPQWIVEDYKDSWSYKGPGFILVNDVSNEVVVLEEDKHFDGNGIQLNFTKKGTTRFGLKTSADYHYWFDIVTAKNKADVLANYNWDLTKSGKQELIEKGIPLTFAGVIETQHKNARSYYFAGDFNDISTTPVFYQMKGLSQLQKMMNLYSNESFYWNTYVPMMKTILEDLNKDFKETEKVIPKKEGEASYTTRVMNDSFEVLVNDKWEKLKIKGVNIGMAKPETFPGEAAITEEEYYRWFKSIGEMGSNSIRIYTLHPPGFYNALKRYNEEHDQPIYVFHGIWIDEGSLLDTLDAFHEKNTIEFQAEMKRIVDVIHGNAVIRPRAGHAGGTYRADISPYVIGWIMGTEWDPSMVQNTNDSHKNKGDYDGTYFQTVKGDPFEYWLAAQLDVLVSYEIDQYNWIRPVSFTNWVTTDLLTHPSEPNDVEDLVSVNPNMIQTKGALKKTNQFASYHVYPYYPDFLNYEADYQKYVDHRGDFNNYAAYLKDLHKAHSMPVLIAEFGVPASRGLTHENPFGWNQGFLSEKEQGDIIVRLYEDIMHEGLLGGLIFTWQDEWFKRTWNTMDYDNPDRRPFWSNTQTNEQQFGLLSFDRNKIKVDGKSSDWNQVSPLYTKKNGNLQKLYMDYDERYLYFRINMNDVKNGYPIIVLDTVPDQGNHTSDTIKDVSFQNGIDFMINLKGPNQSRVLVDAYYDSFVYHYGHDLKMIKPQPSEPVNNSGSFHQINLALNREQYIPKENKKIPFSYYETGKLRLGNANPASSEYDSLADYFVNEESGTIEVRIPWLLLNVKDPSQREAMSNIYKRGLDASTKIEGIKAGLLFIQSDGKVIDSLPALNKGKLPNMELYSWDTWDLPKSEERLKESYYIVKKAFTSK
ncbi:hypothetical protein [Domibacillus aminovorans]|uniref:Family 2 glycosyl transferase n=1 Tax=Domibacillus aminovorans TaxID=29332 RepID=A0A177L3P4_9BACI|nr:hypothetical protein [Domibacillus aminovorans]OAH60310.1 hypothetical protein AWH49_16985 [Domibacillus aminovorans]